MGELAFAGPQFRPQENYRRRRWEFASREISLATAAKDEMVGFLGGFPWEWYFTGTFRGAPGPGMVGRAWERLITELTLRAGSPRYFCCTELQKRNVPHYHALLFGVKDSMLRMDVVKWWFRYYGIARVWPYDPARGAAGYVSKYVLKDNARSGDWAVELGPIQQKRIGFPEGVPRATCSAGGQSARRETCGPRSFPEHGRRLVEEDLRTGGGSSSERQRPPLTSAVAAVPSADTERSRCERSILSQGAERQTISLLTEKERAGAWLEPPPSLQGQS